ncbi:hypothetical protein KR222_009005, partial [Zaprionus bogoriensis]
YVAIIDAGSTGSRIIVYRFEDTESNELHLLAGDFFHESKPGLSSYVDDPAKGVQSIHGLLDAARKFIPATKLASTQLLLRATAGLRMAAPDKADRLLNELRAMFDKSGFRVDSNAIKIIDGADEGIFSWTTVNYLLDRLNQTNRPLAAIDLGGGSAQITFPLADAKETSLYPGHVRSLTLSERRFDVFTHSYLRLGFQAARYQILRDGNRSSEATALQTVCLSPSTTDTEWTYENVEYRVSGKPNGQAAAVDIDACLEVIRKNVQPLIESKPQTLEQHQVVAWNKFFVHVFHLGNRGKFTVGALKQEADATCANVQQKTPFMCLDLIYTWWLLHEGFGLPDDFKVEISSKVSGHFVSWTLGCALNAL